jgi:DNA-binding transcriptional LysR family regulator
MHHDLQVNRLRALVSVVDLGGFRKAAESLHITQPAVSQQIRHLSSFIRGPVFTSTGRNLRLSPQGEELLGYARRIVALNDEAVSRFESLTKGAQLSIGIVDQLAETLPEVLRSLLRGLPDGRVRMRTGLSEALETQVAAGQLDLALVFQPGMRRGSVAQRALGTVRMDWFGQPAHREGTALPIALSTAPCTVRDRALRALNSSGTPWRAAYEGPELAGLRAAAKVGLGIACLIANGDEVWELPRAVLPALPAPPDPVQVSMAFPPDAGGTELAKTAESAFRQALSGYPFAECEA